MPEMTDVSSSADSLMGRRVEMEGKRATVLFQGAVGNTKGTWLGVEWDDPTRGKHDGTHEGVRYFTPSCTDSPTSCSFLRLNKVNLGIDMMEGVKLRYGRIDGATAGVGQEDIDELQKEIGARFVQVVGFDKVNSQQSRLDRLRSICIRDMKINDNYIDLKSSLPSLVDLDISENLVSSWERVTDLVSQVDLEVLNASFNRLPVTCALNADRFPQLAHLILGEMNYTWADAELLAGDLPCLHTLQLHRNRVSDITVAPGKFARLKELDLNLNAISSWVMVNNLSEISSLEMLRLNANSIDSIDIVAGTFKALKCLQLNENKVSDWASIAQLNQLNLTELRLRDNPVLNREKADIGRFIQIALIKSLKVLNGSTINEDDRKWAEIDYLKKHGSEYLKIMKLPETEQNAALESFTASRGRYLEIVERLGAPEEGELKVIESNLKASLVAVKVRLPDVPGSADTVKKLPLSMTVAKLKALVGRLFRQSMKGGGELQLSIQSSKNQEQEENLDNDLRELAYYSLESGDILLVRW